MEAGLAMIMDDQWLKKGEVFLLEILVCFTNVDILMGSLDVFLSTKSRK